LSKIIYGIDKICLKFIIFEIKKMAFSEGISRLQLIIDFISSDYKNKKEIMAHLRSYNIIISYRTLERDLKQIDEVLYLELEYKKNYGYRCENSSKETNIIAASPNNYKLPPTNVKIGFETNTLKVVNLFEYNGVNYCNCLDKINNEIVLISY